MSPLLGPDGETVIGDEQAAVQKLSKLPSFTLGECAAIHTALLVSRAHIEENRNDIIEKYGKPTFNAMKNNVHSAILKLSVMVADSIDEQADANLQTDLQAIANAQENGESNDGN